MPIDSNLGTFAVRPGVCTSSSRPGNPYPGLLIYETDTFRTLLHDGTGWIIMSEPWQVGSTSMTAGVGTITTMGPQTMMYHRSDGVVDFRARYRITTNGTASTYLQATLPIAPEASIITDSSIVATGREGTVTSATLVCQAGGTGMQIITYNNAYPGGTNADLRITGRYQMATRYS